MSQETTIRCWILILKSFWRFHGLCLLGKNLQVSPIESCRLIAKRYLLNFDQLQWSMGTTFIVVWLCWTVFFGFQSESKAFTKLFSDLIASPGFCSGYLCYEKHFHSPKVLLRQNYFETHIDRDCLNRSPCLGHSFSLFSLRENDLDGWQSRYK